MARINKNQNELSRLFDNQMDTLLSRGCPQAILESFIDQRNDVLSTAEEMEIPRNHIPFVPVIPRTYVGIYGLMPMVRNNHKMGYTYLHPYQLDEILISNNMYIPEDPYFIYDIEDGQDTLGLLYEKAKNLIEKDQGRHCLTAQEGIAMCIHSKTPSKNYYVACLDSWRSNNHNEVPAIDLRAEGPRLLWEDLDTTSEEKGYPSCRTRITENNLPF